MNPSAEIDLHTLPTKFLVDLVRKLREENKSQHDLLLTSSGNLDLAKFYMKVSTIIIIFHELLTFNMSTNRNQMIKRRRSIVSIQTTLNMWPLAKN